MNTTSGIYDPLEDEDRPEPGKPRAGPVAAPPKPDTKPEKKRFLQFYKPSELADYVVPDNVPLVGDFQIFRGGVFVLGGASGVGKSFCLSQLAVSGATGADWFGLPVHRKFKTLILQAENGLIRLGPEYKVHCETAALDEWVMVSSDVDTFAFEDPYFCAEFRAVVEDFKPDVIVLDPWNRAARDNQERDYQAAFNNIVSCLPEDRDERPALMIVAHTRKPKMGERVNGRGLLNLLSGSLVLGSIPRAVFILQAASEATEGNEFVFCCCKNNNGQLGTATAWKREGVKFVGPLQGFDWESFNNGGSGGPGKNAKIEESHLEEIFENGRKWLSKAAAAQALMKLTGAGRAAAYGALDKTKGRFAELLKINPANGEMSIEEPLEEMFPDDE